MIKFSLIMAAYNAEQYIKQAIESVINQSYQNWQLIIVDDGSTDKTFEIVKEISLCEERICLIQQDNSGTAAGARQTALQYVNGEYVQMLDSDDYLSNDCLEKIHSKLCKGGNENSIVLPLLFSVNDEKEVLNEIGIVSKLQNKIIDSIEAFELSLDWKVHGCFCVPSKIIKRIGYDTKLINGDEFTTRKLLYNADKVLFCDGIYYYRNNLNSTTKSKKNSTKLYQTIITNGNIYEYSVACNMKNSIRKKCLNKWLRSLISFQAEFNHKKRSFSDNEKKYIYQLLRNEYYRIANENEDDKSVFGLLFKFSNNQYSLFTILVEVYYVSYQFKMLVEYILKK